MVDAGGPGYPWYFGWHYANKPEKAEDANVMIDEDMRVFVKKDVKKGDEALLIYGPRHDVIKNAMIWKEVGNGLYKKVKYPESDSETETEVEEVAAQDIEEVATGNKRNASTSIMTTTRAKSKKKVGCGDETFQWRRRKRWKKGEKGKKVANKRILYAGISEVGESWTKKKLNL